MPRGTLKHPYRPPVKTPSLPPFMPRLWAWTDAWTYNKPQNEPGFWVEYTKQWLDPMYAQGQRCFVLNLPFGLTGKANGQYEYDAGLYRTGPWVSELIPTLSAYKESHSGLVLMVYQGDMVTVFKNPDGSDITNSPANLKTAQARIEAATALVEPIADMIGIDGSARYNPALDLKTDPANNGMYAWFAARADDVRKKKPVVIEAIPLASNTWASTQPWICQDEVFDTQAANPVLLQGAPAGQERIIILHSLASTDARWLPKIQQYQKQGYSVAPSHLWAYVTAYHRPLKDVSRYFQ